ncbi:hypothetical protein BH24ACT20_BH24ACT20_05270 [soil metagenome]|jgi:uncharacterized BrkB/YihY/UPF0761 family membrane protein
MKSVISLLWGILLALGVGLLTIFGIIWPLFMTFFDTELAWSRVLAGLLLVFVVAFSFYWGGMIASYKAPSKRRLHGMLVAPAAFVISPALNVLTGQGLFPGLDSFGTAAGVVGMLAISTAAAYIGASRGETVYAHNQDYIRKRRDRKLRQEQESRQG